MNEVHGSSTQHSVKENQIYEMAKNEVHTQISKWKKSAYFWSVVFLVVMGLIAVISMWYIADLSNDMLLKIKESVQSSMQSANDVTSQEEVKEIGIQIERNNLLSADYLAVVLPILIALSGSFIAFLGMNRLKMFDERIDKTRADMLSELETMVKNQVIADRAQYAKEIEEAIQEQSNQFTNMLKHSKDEFEQIKCKHVAEIEEAGNDFSWLKEAAKTEDFDLSIHSVIDAHNQVEILRRSRPTNYVTLVKTIVDRVCGNKPLSGDSADYHNLSAELARGSLYYEATKVLQRGLTLFGNDPDLLADLIHYATQGGMMNIAQEAYNKLDGLDKRLWTWRCYIFSSGYFKTIGNLNEADKLCDDCIQALPTDEHGYREKAEIVKLLTPGMGGIKNCIYILERALRANINCPQCASLLAETHLELGKYQEALDAANRAILELAQEQPRVNVSYVFYIRATCYDRMFLHSIKEKNQDTNLAVLACLDYKTALDFNKLASSSAQQAATRIRILGTHIENDP